MSGSPLPPYTYVPGQSPHPSSDPAGHAYGLGIETVPLNSTEKWRESTSFLWGMELFSKGFYWEAHEAWEGLWKPLPPGGVRDFVQGLIKMAAAGVKCLEGNTVGARRHAARAKELFQRSNLTDREPWVKLAATVELNPPICAPPADGRQPQPLSGWST